jgi:hypothetical protein
VLVLVILLVVTNLATLGALAYVHTRPDEVPHPDPDVAAVLDRSTAPPSVTGGTRRLISVEVLNPIELAGTRGRLAGIAGSLVPGITRRIVNDQTLKILKQQLAEQHVVADVRLHTLRPIPPTPAPVTSAPVASPATAAPAPVTQYVDQVEHVDLEQLSEPDVNRP